MPFWDILPCVFPSGEYTRQKFDFFIKSNDKVFIFNKKVQIIKLDQKYVPYLRAYLKNNFFELS